MATDKERESLDLVEPGYSSGSLASSGSLDGGGSLDGPVYVDLKQREIKILKSTPRDYKGLYQVTRELEKIVKRRESEGEGGGKKKKKR
jgi:hypothetical protein